jgi:hypothetical protein
VTREVLPAIRQTGGYRLAGVAPEAVEEGTVAEMPDVAGMMAELQITISRTKKITIPLWDNPSSGMIDLSLNIA